MPDCIKAIVSKILRQNGPDTLLQITSEPYSSWCSFTSLSSRFHLTSVGDVLTSELIDNEQNIPRKVLDLLRHKIRHTTNAANAGRLPKHDAEAVVVIFHALQFLLDWEIGNARSNSDSSGAFSKWRVNDCLDHELYLENPYCLDVSSIKGTAGYFWGRRLNRFVKAFLNISESHTSSHPSRRSCPALRQLQNEASI